MKVLLHIDTSARIEGSHSRALAAEFAKEWKATHSGGTVIKRDLALNPPAHVDALTTAAFTTPEDQRSADLTAAAEASDALVKELQSADELLISAPMYNFGVPSTLKAYIDHVTRAGQTFAYDPESGFAGLLKAKRAYLAFSYGGSGYLDGAFTSMDFLTPYLKGMLGFLGIETIKLVYVEGSVFDEVAFAASKKRIADQIDVALNT